jgi:type IV pilus assembly protein PilA
MEPIMHAQRGKTNITAIAVIVLIVVIVLIALPVWRNHRISGHVSDALGATDAAKVAVTEAATVHGGLARVKASELGYNTAASISPYAAHVEVADGGRITLVTKGTGATPDIQLLLTPEQSPTSAITWICTILVGDADAVPDNCRKMAATNAPVSAASAATAATAK